jgi:universal stress protein A
MNPPRNPVLPSDPAHPAPDASVSPQPGPLPAPSPGTVRLREILTPIDFSDASQKALRYATALAEQFRASLKLLHVVELSLVGSDFGAIEMSRLMTDLQVNAQKELAEWMQREVGNRVPALSLVRAGRPHAEILAAARELGADLILLASHGHSSLAHVVLGSTVERVVRQAPCPVLVVRPQEHEFV